MRLKKTILILLLILIPSIPLSTVHGQTYIVINENGVEGSDSILQDGNVFTFIETIRNPIRIEIDDIILDGSNNKMEVVTSYDAITATGRTNIIIQNIHIRIARNGIVLESSNMCIIQNCTIKTSNDGIRLTDASTQNIILENTIYANGRVGIFLKEQSNDNKISGNIINENSEGIQFKDAHRLEVFDNQINGNEYCGGHSDASNENLFHHNEVNENLWGLALTDGSTNNRAYENVFNDNARGIEVIEADNNSVYDNEMGYNIDYGICLDVCTLNHFYQNNIHDNNGGININQAEGNFFYSNNFVDNGKHVTYDAEKNIWNLEPPEAGGNYWDDYTGEDLDGDGYGDTPRHFRSIIIGGVETIDTDNLDYFPLMQRFRKVSTITCTVDRSTLIEDESVEVSGIITPVEPVTRDLTLIFEGPDGMEEIDYQTDVEGVYSYHFTPGPGSWSVYASWMGDSEYHSARSESFEFTVEEVQVEEPEPEPEVEPLDSLITLSLEPANEIYETGESYALLITLKDQDTEEGLSNALIHLKIEKPDGSEIQQEYTTNADGTYRLESSWDLAGSWTYTANWEGNENYLGTEIKIEKTITEATVQGGPNLLLLVVPVIVLGAAGYYYFMYMRKKKQSVARVLSSLIQ